MLGFILSKMNLLILVTAMFAIVAFFSFGLADIAKINAANLLLNQMTSMGEVVANSNASCDTSSYFLPAYLETGGGNLYYAVKVSKVKITDPEGGSVNNVIFSAMPRLDQKYVFAANSFRTAAEVNIYSREYISRRYEGSYVNPCSGAESCGAVADPQARDRMNTIVFIKERVGTKDLLHIITCSAELCEVVIDNDVENILGRELLCGKGLS
jgi:hypothetical protein